MLHNMLPDNRYLLRPMQNGVQAQHEVEQNVVRDFTF
jgi:hypothetical protein